LGDQDRRPNRGERPVAELSETEKTGIIANAIASVHDEPTLVWRAKLTIRKSGGHKRLSVSKQMINSHLR
jgi:hypothetical protein